ncbi:hypothetical protein EDD18DRAFT_136103 [Armillaria luteobubalina]|uniref:Uncharacterized protein n=1 Tax=Armillaria luteobubalina TaxID=153913 RepID=A0AA39TAS8_9AGAR|nr:hypothetical protein EDD18DRAFT_136103 [Armillaria luteobubalina]
MESHEGGDVDDVSVRPAARAPPPRSKHDLSSPFPSREGRTNLPFTVTIRSPAKCIPLCRIPFCETIPGLKCAKNSEGCLPADKGTRRLISRNYSLAKRTTFRLPSATSSLRYQPRPSVEHAAPADDHHIVPRSPSLCMRVPPPGVGEERRGKLQSHVASENTQTSNIGWRVNWLVLRYKSSFRHAMNKSLILLFTAVLPRSSSNTTTQR